MTKYKLQDVSYGDATQVLNFSKVLRKNSSEHFFPLVLEISLNVWGTREQDLKVIILTIFFGPSLSRTLHNRHLNISGISITFFNILEKWYMKHETWNCFKGISGVLHGCFRGVFQILFWYVSLMFQGYNMVVSGVFHGCFSFFLKCVSWVFHECFLAVTDCLQCI